MRRWGVRTLAFLFVMFVAVAWSSIQGAYTNVTVSLLVIGVLGAVVCSIRGLMTASWKPPTGLEEADQPGGATESRTTTGHGK